jgi:hypothetical protein
MTAASPVLVVVGTGFAAIVLAVFFDRVTQINHTQARLTGTLHLGNSRHGTTPLNLFFNYYNI